MDSNRIFVRGVFTRKSTGMLWEFREIGNKDNHQRLRIWCSFVPVLHVVQYTLSLSMYESLNNYSIRFVHDDIRLPWSKRIANALDLADYKEDETFKDYCKRVDGSKVFSVCNIDLLRQWVRYNRIKYMRVITQTPLMDVRKNEELMDNLDMINTFKLFKKDEEIGFDKNGKLLVNTPLPLPLPNIYDPSLYLYSDLLLGVSKPTLQLFTVIQELKDEMKMRSVSKLDVTTQLKKLPTRMNKLTCKVASKNPLFSFDQDIIQFNYPSEQPVVELKPHEPVDEYVDKLIPWKKSKEQDKPPEIPVFKYLGSVYISKERKKLMRFCIDHESCFHQIREVIREREFKKVLFIFADFDSTRNCLETGINIQDGYRAVVRRRSRNDNNNRFLWAKRLTNGYSVKNKQYSEDDFWKEFISVQTCGLYDIKFIPECQPDVVFLFNSTLIVSKWITWCDYCCGKDVAMCLVKKRQSRKRSIQY